MVTNLHAVFARELQVDSRRLRKTRDSLAELAANPAALENHRLEVVRLLAALRDQLAIHFALEEADGYFDEERDVAPHLVARAEVLRAEHAVLFDIIRRIVEEAEQYVVRNSPVVRRKSARRRDSASESQRFARIVRRFQVFDQRLGAHESHDNALMLDAFETDIGGGD